LENQAVSRKTGTPPEKGKNMKHDKYCATGNGGACDCDTDFEWIKERRNAVGQILHGDYWREGHDYDEGEKTLWALATLIPKEISGCKIDCHVPNDDGQTCQCGYFIKKA
jgi:hypothetical protein